MINGLLDRELVAHRLRELGYAIKVLAAANLITCGTILFHVLIGH